MISHNQTWMLEAFGVKLLNFLQSYTFSSSYHFCCISQVLINLCLHSHLFTGIFDFLCDHISDPLLQLQCSIFYILCWGALTRSMQLLYSTLQLHSSSSVLEGGVHLPGCHAFQTGAVKQTSLSVYIIELLRKKMSNSVLRFMH